MIFTPTTLLGSYTIDLQPFTDNRGWFSRTYCKHDFQQIKHDKEWVQMNHSVTFKKGTIRGIHYQLPPFSEIKMVRCIVGAIYDVIVDIRSSSPTYLQWFGAEISAINKKMMYIPEGFAHGFQTLTNDCELIYHHSNFYTPNAEGGIKFNDKSININWPITVTEISERDNLHPLIDANFKGL